MSFVVVIPARYASTRFPGKPLADLGGKPMLQHVYQNACSSNAKRVIVATDDRRIESVALGFGAEVCMTEATHNSGTERLAEVVRKLTIEPEEIVVNVQGDEPKLPGVLMNQVANLLKTRGEDAVMATLCEPIEDTRVLFNPSVVKVVFDASQTAVYFSRAPIPWSRDTFGEVRQTMPQGCQYFRHLGIYAYRAHYLSRFVELARCDWEQTERLEQLRVLYYGGKIAIDRALTGTGPGIDTPEDLDRARCLEGR